MVIINLNAVSMTYSLLFSDFQDRNFNFEVDTTFDEFNEIIMDDQRCATLDPGNIKFAFNSVSLIS